MPTLFVEADEPLLVFPSVEMAERCLEAEDVHNGVYPRAFGPSGERFSVTAEGGQVTIRSIAATADASGLSALLRRYLEAVGEPMTRSVTLPELVAAAEAYWAKHDTWGDRFSKPVPWRRYVLAIAGVAGIAMFLWL